MRRELELHITEIRIAANWASPSFTYTWASNNTHMSHWLHTFEPHTCTCTCTCTCTTRYTCTQATRPTCIWATCFRSYKWRGTQIKIAGKPGILHWLLRVCNTLQHTWQHAAPHCNTYCNTHCKTRDRNRNRRQTQHPWLNSANLRHTATHCNTLQHNAIHETEIEIAGKPGILHWMPWICNILQHALQHTTTHCNTRDRNRNRRQTRHPPLDAVDRVSLRLLHSTLAHSLLRRPARESVYVCVWEREREGEREREREGEREIWYV